MFADPSQAIVKVEEDDALIHSVFESFGALPDVIGLDHEGQPQFHPAHPHSHTHAHTQHAHAQAAHPPHSTQQDDPNGDEPNATKRKRPHNGKACVNCRRR